MIEAEQPCDLVLKRRSVRGDDEHEVATGPPCDHQQIARSGGLHDGIRLEIEPPFRPGRVAFAGVIPRHRGVVRDALVLVAQPDEPGHLPVDTRAAEKLPKLARAVELVLVRSLGVGLDGREPLRDDAREMVGERPVAHDPARPYSAATG